MDTKGIDLTKCNNLRYKAKVAGKEVEGRIAVDGDYLRFFYSNRDIYSIHIPCYREHGKVDYFDDLDIVPRDPETYQDWQVGDNDIVIFRSGELVVLADDFTEENRDVTAVNTCSQLFDRREGRLVLTDIEQKIIEERKEKKVAEDIPKSYEFRYGEPVLVRNGGCENWGIASYCRSEGTMDKVYVGSLTAFFVEVIPYNERTMHLLGTNEDYKEEQR